MKRAQMMLADRILTERQHKQLFAEAVNVINGLLKVARIAMPDTYYATDSRVVKAKALLRKLKGQTP